MPRLEPQINWKDGSVFIQNGYIYVSPNCKRAVRIPPHTQGSNPPNPFTGGAKMKVEDFKQPVWWNFSDGWMSFIPLAPSYLPKPFAPLCWMPQLQEKGRHRDEPVSYQISWDDGMAWLDAEKRIVEAVIRVRNAFKIPTSLPPFPSKLFKFDQSHPSREQAKVAVERGRDWFAIWMGLLSFCIAYSKRVTFLTNEWPDAGPLWYQKLYQGDPQLWPQGWLDALQTSCVCQFDNTVPRAGIVVDWTEKLIPDLELFLGTGTPLFYPWTSTEESASTRTTSLKYLIPPAEMLQDALTLLFASPSVSMAALIFHKFYSKKDDNSPLSKATLEFLRVGKGPSVVRDMGFKEGHLDLDKMIKILAEPRHVLECKVQNALLEQQTRVDSEAFKAADVPTQGLVEDEDEWRSRGRLVEDPRAWFDAREKRTQELIAAENQSQKMARLNRERNPGLQKSDVYEWTKTQSLGRKILYIRLRVPKKHNADVVGRYPKSQRIYNARHDEWDVCEYLNVKPNNNVHNDAQDNDYSDEEDFWNANVAMSAALPAPPQSSSSSKDVIMVDWARQRPIEEQIELEGKVQQGLYGGPFTWRGRSLDTYLRLAHGYIGPADSHREEKQDETMNEKDWQILLRNLGFAPSSKEDQSVHPSMPRRALESFFLAISSKEEEQRTVPGDLFDLNPSCCEPAERMLIYKTIHRPSKDIYVFSLPRSVAVKWMVGVESAEVVLYCIRFISQHGTNRTIMHLASELVTRGIKFRTLLGLDVSPRFPSIKTIQQAYEPKTFREKGHKFTKDDFTAWISQVEELFSRARFRAGLLRGGIVARISRQFQSVDCALEGPSWEMTGCRVGFVAPSNHFLVVYGDDELSEDDLATLCGAYAIYDEKRKRMAIKYWFPPQHIWDSLKSGHSALEWTPLNEQWFTKLWADYESECRSQPKTAEQWQSAVRGSAASRYFKKKSSELAQAWCDKHIPAKMKPPPSLLERMTENTA